MTKLFKKITATAAAMMTLGALCVGASAATYHNWRAVGRNIPGAPTSVISEPDVFSISHGKEGATAKMSGLVHDPLYPEAIAYTYINCTNFEMDPIELTQLEEDYYTVAPDVGSPIEDISVGYSIYVTTNITGDTATSTGRISKKA